ncbi:hypothetical protein [Lysobacter sp. HA18]
MKLPGILVAHAALTLLFLFPIMLNAYYDPPRKPLPKRPLKSWLIVCFVMGVLALFDALLFVSREWAPAVSGQLLVHDKGSPTSYLITPQDSPFMFWFDMSFFVLMGAALSAAILLFVGLLVRSWFDRRRQARLKS